VAREYGGCQARSRVLGFGGQGIFLKGQDFCFTICLKQICLGPTKFEGHKKKHLREHCPPTPSCGYGPGGCAYKILKCNGFV